MGRRSSSDSEDGGRKERRTNRRRRSRSSSRSSSSSSSHSRKRLSAKTSKKRSKSPSRSSRNRRSRSNSSDRYARSSRSKRSTRSRRSRSRSAGRHSKGQRSRQSRSPSIQEIFVKIEKPDVSTDVKKELSRSQKTPEEQLKIKMQMALKAAADADAMLREKGVLSAVKQERGIAELEKPVKSENPISVSEQINRATTIDEINSDGFRQQEFKSGRSITTTNVVVQNSQIDDHDISIFGSNAETNELTNVQTAAANPVQKLGENLGQIAHDNLYTDVAAKQERWIRRLYNMRQKKLNGEAMA